MDARLALPASVCANEIRTYMWRRRTAYLLLGSLVTLVSVALAVLLARRADATSQVGKELFQGLSLTTVLILLISVPLAAGDAVSGEREVKTWDLIVLSRVPSVAMSLGKAAGGIMFAVTLVVSAAPMFAIAASLASFQTFDVLRMCAVFVCTGAVVTTLSVAVSSMIAGRIASLCASLGLTLVAGIGLAVLTLHVGSGSLDSAVFDARQTPLDALSPFAAVASALPRDGTGIEYFLVATPAGAPLWAAYCALSMVLSAGFLAITGVFARNPPRWWPADVR